MDELVEDVDPATLTLCTDCAKHPSLKRFVRNHGVIGVRCGICLKESTESDTCALSARDQLIYLIRSLIRFYYDESDYNRHFGAEDGAEALLQKDNPILVHENWLWKWRSKKQSEPFLWDVFSNTVYPPVDRGVAIYAGFDEDGGRNFHRAIRHGDSGLLRSFQMRLQTENYFDLEPDLRAIFDQVDDRIASEVPVGEVFYRARIGHAARLLRPTEGLDYEVLLQPFTDAALGAPPPQAARAGRLNRVGVAFLYLATDVETACAEVRPHPNHLLSIGGFRSLRPLKVANLDTDIAAFAANENELALYSFVYAADLAVSLPVLPEEAARYSITQLIAEVLRQRGFDGVAFKSSVAQGRNLCVFRLDAFNFIAGTASVQRVNGLVYDLEEMPSTEVESTDDQPMG